MWKKSLARISCIAIVGAALVAGSSSYALAGGGGKDGSTPPKPDRERKVYTNDDMTALHTGAPQAPGVSSFTPAPAEIAPATVRLAPAPYDLERDPVFYARQAVELDEQAAGLDAEIAKLRNFRLTSTGLTTGLGIYAPCQGVGTDNLIAELAQQRQAISTQISDLEDTARRNDVPPGTFVNAAALVAAAATRVKITPAGERALLTARLERLSGELAQANGVASSMQQDMAAQRMTLLKYNGDGGNMTTNLLENLNGQAKDLRAEIAATSDEAYRAGIPAASLP